MIALREDAVKIFFLGVEVYAFGLYVAIGLALALVALALLTRRSHWKKETAPVAGLLGIIFGLALSRLLYGLLDEALGRVVPLWGMIRLETGGYSMIGALAGGCLGGMLAARLTGQDPVRMLDVLSPALLLFVACERLGEGYILDFGVSRTLTDGLLEGTFLAVENDGTWRLATYLLESFASLILSLILIRDLNEKRRRGDTFLLFLLLYGAVQTLLESLRYDQHMTVIAFVKLQQVFAMALLGVAVILLALRRWNTRRKTAIAGMAAVVCAVGLGVAIEFMIDRTTISHYLLYLAFLAVIAAPTALGLALRKEELGGKA